MHKLEYAIICKVLLTTQASLLQYDPLSWCFLQVEDPATSDMEHWVIAKGAPEVILEHLESAPAHYQDCYKSFAAQGARYVVLLRLLVFGYRRTASVLPACAYSSAFML